MSSLSIANRQSHRRIDARLLRQLTLHLCGQLLAWPDYEISLVLLDSSAMARLNFDHLQHQGSTDVITFDYSTPETPSQPQSPAKFHGEIFISIADALAQARQFRRPWQEELARYVVHGALHLSGHDDLSPAPRRAMKRQENRLLKELSRRFDLRKLERSETRTAQPPRAPKRVRRHR